MSNSKIHLRIENNIKILDILKQLVYEFPDMRFNQLLEVIEVVKKEDQFNEESSVTLENLRNFIKNKQEMFNQLKYIKVD